MFRGGQPNMQQMMKQMQQLQLRMAKVQEELEQKTITAESGGGAVKVTVNGKQAILKIEIQPEVVNPADKDMLEDLVLTAVNQAIERSTAMAAEEMNKVTGGMMPPGMKLPGL
jgi:DNA-binding YbaB/EbfC family protein